MTCKQTSFWCSEEFDWLNEVDDVIHTIAILMHCRSVRLKEKTKQQAMVTRQRYDVILSMILNSFAGRLSRRWKVINLFESEKETLDEELCLLSPLLVL